MQDESRKREVDNARSSAEREKGKGRRCKVKCKVDMRPSQ